ncbi:MULTISPECIES: LacI family DNA-binding transcriptional regulator [Anaerococcus]|uniref:Degradation activator n=1 Tax=Anaerococcus octavius TaxID=54007 RepID=A0A2I1MBD9_9FIRM|nr:MULTISPECIES: LacI family DNA-binding transcriptional regulator [Anaerococcus]MBS6105333.1 LacI family DNA-binding transcriptional regulator [Anaerococcus sp.]MDU2598709.1 LacI family DNA-binding transcriptional regulator [Anaerococcus sp.]MDU3177100.1 LacI family DNA-binding transcriptional regulator [Anaerococcus sp.]MDU5228910.1 LacI family DNA-binding transcriptional regulator [Anaerococcus sp.]MDU5534431.1 LacI family DNA-binding transcriptional regulator [Anaerococcus sp.]
MTNIKDVAKEAGVSITTVSMVLNNTENKISQATRKKVLKAANNLNYKPNSYAKALASKKSNIIMAIVPDINNPFFSELVKELTQFAQEYSYFLYIHNTNNQKIKNQEFEKLLVSNFFAATLVVDRNVKNLDEDLVKKHNIIFLDEVDFASRNTQIVTGNNEIGGYIAMEYLIKRGFKNIGLLIGPRSTANSSRRLSGAIKAAMNYDIYIDPKNIIHGDYTYEEGYATGKFFKKRNVDAIFSFADMSSYGLINYFLEEGIKIPEDISLISYDNLFLNKIITPKLTSVDQNLREIAKNAIMIADELIKNDKVQEKIMIKPEIVEGESVGFKNENN